MTGIRLVDPGNVVHPSDQNGIVVVTQLDPMAVIFTLPQDQLVPVSNELAKGPLQVDAYSRDGATLLGTGDLALIDNQINPSTSTIRLKALIPKLSSALPQGLEVMILSDRTETVRASVDDVQFTLLLSVVLVVAVIYLFLRSLKATVIPGVAVPLSLIGTFGVMYLLGYSLNNLSLMALTISTGFVVDDAIVMIENIARYVEAGEPPFEAALKGAKQIGFTIVSLTVSLVAVLIPLLFMGGIIGRLFREFAVTLAIAIGVSALLSLTLTAMMSAFLLGGHERPGRIARAFERGFGRTVAFYERTLRWVLDRQPLTLTVTIATLLLTVVLALVVPKGFSSPSRTPGSSSG